MRLRAPCKGLTYSQEACVRLTEKRGVVCGVQICFSLCQLDLQVFQFTGLSYCVPGDPPTPTGFADLPAKVRLPAPAACEGWCQSVRPWLKVHGNTRTIVEGGDVNALKGVCGAGGWGGTGRPRVSTATSSCATRSASRSPRRCSTRTSACCCTGAGSWCWRRPRAWSRAATRAPRARCTRCPPCNPCRFTSCVPAVPVSHPNPSSSDSQLSIAVPLPSHPQPFHPSLFVVH
jgi:hypothetical protein